jgi:hypothetical protein
LGVLLSSVSSTSESANCLDPAKDLLDALTDTLADSVALVAHGATVDRRATVGVLGDMRGDVGLSASLDEVGTSVTPICPNGDSVLSLPPHHQ